MRVKALILALSAAAAAPVFAQAVGTVANVSGAATVITGSSGAPAVPGAPVMNGARVITTSTGTVTLRMNNGCTIVVPAGHAVTVQSNLTCDQLMARIQPVTVTTTSTVSTVPVGMGFSSSNVGPGILALGAIAGIIVDVNAHDDDQPISGR